MNSPPLIPLPYHVEISPVREVILLGTVDHEFWYRKLGDAQLTPLLHEGNALAFISAMQSKFMGLTFRELLFGLFLSANDQSRSQDAMYLVQAFNSIRFFAFVERTFFHTPYRHGRIQVDVQMPTSFGLEVQGHRSIQLQMGDATREAKPQSDFVDSSPTGWKGPIYLPGKSPVEPRVSRAFFARLKGTMLVYPWNDSDRIMTSVAGIPAVEWLTASRFQPQEWLIRREATHAKSKTVDRVVADRWRSVDFTETHP